MDIRDLYLCSNVDCLVYSEILQEFTSFISYEGTSAMFNIGEDFYSLYNKNNVFLFKNLADYSGSFNQTDSSNSELIGFDVTFIENQLPESDKIFTNLEFRSDTWDNNNLITNETFNYLQVYSEYQDTGEIELRSLINKPSNLAKKFRIWRLQIPRDSSNKKDRIRNTWAKFKLIKNTNLAHKTVLYDSVTGYYV